MANSIDKIKVKIDGEDFYWYGEVNERGQADGKGELYDLDGITLRFRGLTENEINRIITYELIFILGDSLGYSLRSEETAIQSFREHTEKYILEREKEKKKIKTLEMVCKNGKLYTGIFFNKRREPVRFYNEGKKTDLMTNSSIFQAWLDLEQYLEVNSNNTKNSSFLSRARKCIGNTCSYVAKKAFNMIRRPDDRLSELYNKAGEKIYEGVIKNGIRQGWGTEFNPKTAKIIFTGDFKNDLRNGTGFEYNQKHSQVIIEGKMINTQYIYKGEYKNGFRHGDGTEYNVDDGGIVFEGEWKNGKPYREKSLRPYIMYENITK